MSMSTHVIGIKPPDEKWIAMKKIWDACQEAGVDPPVKVERFFESDYGSSPDPQGVIVEIPKDAKRNYQGECSDGFEIDVRKLPPDVTIIRFYNSW
jgi:hypothetical protein